VSVLRVRGYALPEGEPVDLYADGDRWATEPVAAAELVAEGWLLPGLVDAHTHPGAGGPGQPLDDGLLREDLREHVAAGVTMIRSPGLAGDPPDWFGQDPWPGPTRGRTGGSPAKSGPSPRPVSGRTTRSRPVPGPPAPTSSCPG
jgi:hypothetical protein